RAGRRADGGGGPADGRVGAGGDPVPLPDGQAALPGEQPPRHAGPDQDAAAGDPPPGGPAPAGRDRPGLPGPQPGGPPQRGSARPRARRLLSGGQGGRLSDLTLPREGEAASAASAAAPALAAFRAGPGGDPRPGRRWAVLRSALVPRAAR